MDRIKLDGIPPYDGEYDLDASYFTNRELHTIKTLSGIRAGELEEAFAASDSDLIVALCVIALQRAGITPIVDRIWDAPAGSMTLIGDDSEADEDPTAGTPVEPPSAPGSSGAASTISTEPPASDPSPTGPPSTDIGADSPRLRSAS